MPAHTADPWLELGERRRAARPTSVVMAEHFDVVMAEQVEPEALWRMGSLAFYVAIAALAALALARVGRL